MSNWGRAFAAGILLIELMASDSLRALPYPSDAKVNKAKAASALVVLPSGRGFGSAFCVRDDGIFATSAQVIWNQKKVDLVLNPGEDQQRVVSATVVRENRGDDLALLKVNDPTGLSPLALGDTTELAETHPVAAVGFPKGNLQDIQKQKYPTIAVMPVRVVPFRPTQVRLQFLQVHSDVRLGAAGGAVIDPAGRVVGVVSSAVRSAARRFVLGENRFVVPIERVKTLLDTPRLSLSPAEVSVDKSHEALEFTVRVDALRALPANTIIEVTFGEGASARHFTATAKGTNTFVVTASPVPADEPVPSNPTPISYTLSAKSEGVIIATQRGKLQLASTAKEPKASATTKSVNANDLP
jgi:S1-C subfamily serine protease